MGNLNTFSMIQSLNQWEQGGENQRADQLLSFTNVSDRIAKNKERCIFFFFFLPLSHVFPYSAANGMWVQKHFVQHFINSSSHHKLNELKWLNEFFWFWARQWFMHCLGARETAQRLKSTNKKSHFPMVGNNVPQIPCWMPRDWYLDMFERT